jgi:hypothetical protein
VLGGLHEPTNSWDWDGSLYSTVLYSIYTLGDKTFGPHFPINVPDMESDDPREAYRELYCLRPIDIPDIHIATSLTAPWTGCQHLTVGCCHTGFCLWALLPENCTKLCINAFLIQTSTTSVFDARRKLHLYGSRASHLPWPRVSSRSDSSKRPPLRHMAAVVRSYAAYNITDTGIYAGASFTYVLALAHFTSEWLVYKTTSFAMGLATRSPWPPWGRAGCSLSRDTTLRFNCALILGPFSRGMPRRLLLLSFWLVWLYPSSESNLHADDRTTLWAWRAIPRVCVTLCLLCTRVAQFQSCHTRICKCGWLFDIVH